MELYRLENGMLKKFKGGFVVLDNRIYTNPTEDTVRKAGYKDVVCSEKPAYNEETQYLETVYSENDAVIHEDYKVKDIEIPKEGEMNDI